ncbi:MAG: hypothetical protein Q9170_008253, partial [Blastenia crenularia]
MPKLASSKTATDDTPVAPKDISGDVTTANEIDDTLPRSTRKRAGDFNDFENDEAVVGGEGSKSAPTPTQPKKKSKTTPKADKKTKARKEDGATTSKASKKTKPSKEDGHPVVTEKTHPGGDSVEAEPAADLEAQKKTGRKTGAKDKGAKKDATPIAKKSTSTKKDSEVKGTEKAEEKKGAAKPKARASKAATKKDDIHEALEADSGKTDLVSAAEEQPSRAQAIETASAPHEPEVKENAKAKDKADKKSKEKKDAGSKAKSQKPKAAAEAKPQDDTASTKATAPASSKDAKGKKGTAAKGTEPAPANGQDVSPDQAMDEAPFKKLVKRERAKIPSVKASANAAEAERKALGAADAVKALGKDGEASKSKESKPAESSKADEAKGKKRKEGPDAGEAKVESAPSEKKQRKSRKSALDMASSAVGALVDSGIEVAAQGVNAVKDLASGLGNKSIADDVTAVAEGVADEKAKKEKNAKKRAGKKDRKANRAKGQDGADPVANDSGVDELEDEDEEDFEEGDQTLALIKGFESEGDDEPNDNEGFKEGMKVPQLPKSKELTKKLKDAKDEEKDGEEESGVVYVGLTTTTSLNPTLLSFYVKRPLTTYLSRIPHGFYEPQMRAYFTQFGPLHRLRLSRNRTTGASKHYAFLEFASKNVASIAAETMNNYLLFGHILKCKLVPKEQVHENLWKGANKRFKKVPWGKIEGRKLE